jgi:hypothetical protein
MPGVIQTKDKIVVLYPSEEIFTVYIPAGILIIEKSPLKLDVAVRLPGRSVIETLGRTSPVSASVTLPVKMPELEICTAAKEETAKRIARML